MTDDDGYSEKEVDMKNTESNIMKNKHESTTICPKCGGKMEDGVCSLCKYSESNAYENLDEAKEHTRAG